jgi:septal ring factor EnvC (AmiA/AmiB activator)
MKSTIVFLSAFFLILSGSLVTAQDYDKEIQEIVKKQSTTREEINELSSRIQAFEERIDRTDQKYNEVYSQYENLKKLISLQDNKIRKLDFEQSQIELEIDLTESQISEQQIYLRQLIDNFKKILTFAYKNGRKSDLELLLTSSSINQMLVRSYYLQKFEEQRIKQAQQIRETRNQLEETRDALQDIRERNELVLAEIQLEKNKLNEQEDLQEKNIQILTRDKETLLAQLRTVRQQKEGLENTLDQLISRESELEELEAERLRKLAEARRIADENERATEVARYSTPIRREIPVDDATLTSYGDSFSRLKGQLPWPVSSGTVSEKFGKLRHPVYGTVTENLGIEITTRPEQEVSVVHDGYVYAVQPVPGFGDVVFVRHGRFITAYGNLSGVQAVKGQVLRKGDLIGYSGNENSIRGEALFFMISEIKANRTNEKLNPESWLVRK